jgi:diaminopimelate epimerase
MSKSETAGYSYRFYKYHALGNDYIVLDPQENENRLPEVSQIQRICHRHFGVGSDGILWGPSKTQNGQWAVRIFNPDGSEAEKSGNGLRIFSRYLWDKAWIDQQPATIHTLGGEVTVVLAEEGKSVTVEMGRVSFDSRDIPVEGISGEALSQTMTVDGQKIIYNAASIGNPHCVIIQEEISPQETCRLGPLIENDPRFPHRINVQFLKVLDRQHIQLEIWERGAGYTLASGSSSSAAAAVAVRQGLCDPAMTVVMPGGSLDITVSTHYDILMTGPVTPIAEGTLFAEMFSGESSPNRSSIR